MSRRECSPLSGVVALRPYATVDKEVTGPSVFGGLHSPALQYTP